MSAPPVPPKPPATEGRGSVLRYARAFRRDLLSALPARLYRAWMAEFRSPLIHSVVCNDPALVRLVLQERPEDFPKSARLREGLALTPALSERIDDAAVERLAREGLLVTAPDRLKVTPAGMLLLDGILAAIVR